MPKMRELVLLLLYIGINVCLELELLGLDAAGEALQLLRRAALDLGQDRFGLQHLLRWYLGARRMTGSRDGRAANGAPPYDICGGISVVTTKAHAAADVDS